MRTRTRPLAVAILLLSLFCYTCVNAGSKQADTELARKAKATIAKLGTGFESRVEVKLHNQTKLRGYVSEARDDFFLLIIDGTNAITQVAYSEVEKVKGKNHQSDLRRQETLKKVASIGVLVYLVVVFSVGYSRYYRY